MGRFCFNGLFSANFSLLSSFLQLTVNKLINEIPTIGLKLQPSVVESDHHANSGQIMLNYNVLPYLKILNITTYKQINDAVVGKVSCNCSSSSRWPTDKGTMQSQRKQILRHIPFYVTTYPFGCSEALQKIYFFSIYFCLFN